MTGQQLEHTRKDYTILFIFSVLLIIVGIGIAFWVFNNIYEMFTNPSSMIPFQHLIKETLESSLKFSSQKISLIIPPEILAYFVAIALLSVGARIAGLFLKSGISLYHHTQKQFINEISKLKLDIKKMLSSFQKS
ncbi:MAG: hypothetical protein PVJ50_05355 [Desulfobacterales bacterium]|jgi:hypothetical protein